MSKKIGWQKYEDMLQNQLNCPFGALIATSQLVMSMDNEGEDEEDSQVDFMSALEDEERDILVVPVPDNMTPFKCP